MPNGTYGGVRGKETKVGQKTFVSRPTRLQLNRDHRRIVFAIFMRIVPYHKAQRQTRLAMRLDLRYIDPGVTFAKVTGLYSAAIRSAPQPAGCAGWIELFRYSLMPLGNFARRLHPHLRHRTACHQLTGKCKRKGCDL